MFVNSGRWGEFSHISMRLYQRQDCVQTCLTSRTNRLRCWNSARVWKESSSRASLPSIRGQLLMMMSTPQNSMNQSFLRRTRWIGLSIQDMLGSQASRCLVGVFSKTHWVPGLLGSATSVAFNCPYPDIFIKHFSIICQPSGLRHGDGKLMSESRDGEQWSTFAENQSNGSLSIDDRPNAAYLFFNNTVGSDDEASMNSTRDLSTTSGHGA